MRYINLFSSHLRFSLWLKDNHLQNVESENSILGLASYVCFEKSNHTAGFMITPSLSMNDFHSLVCKGFINPYQYLDPFLFSSGFKHISGWLAIPLNEIFIKSNDFLNFFFSAVQNKLMEIKPYTTVMFFDKSSPKFFNFEGNLSDNNSTMDVLTQKTMAWACEESLHPCHSFVFDSIQDAQKAFDFIHKDAEVSQCLKNIKIQLF